MTTARPAWKQFGISLALMLPWPLAAAFIQSRSTNETFLPTDHLIYLVGLYRSQLWTPIDQAQSILSARIHDYFIYTVVTFLVLMWFVIAALPLFSRWRGRQVIGLWAMQCSYAGSQALAGYFFVKSLLV